jgi:hypothetical protein
MGMNMTGHAGFVGRIIDGHLIKCDEANYTEQETCDKNKSFPFFLRLRVI